MDWEKIFTNNANDKGLISKIYEQPRQFNNKKTKQPNQKYRKQTTNNNYCIAQETVLSTQ